MGDEVCNSWSAARNMVSTLSRFVLSVVLLGEWFCYRVTRPPFFFFPIAMILSFSGSTILPFPSSLVLYVCWFPCRAPNHMLPPSLSSNYKTQIPHPALLFRYLLTFPSATLHLVVQHHTLLAGVYHGLLNEHQPLHMYHHRWLSHLLVYKDLLYLARIP